MENLFGQSEKRRIRALAGLQIKSWKAALCWAPHTNRVFFLMRVNILIQKVEQLGKSLVEVNSFHKLANLFDSAGSGILANPWMQLGSGWMPDALIMCLKVKKISFVSLVFFTLPLRLATSGSQTLPLY